MTRLLALYPVAVTALLLVLPSIAPRSGPLTLVNIFSVHLALAALLLVPVAIARRDRALRFGVLALALVAVIRFGGDWLSLPPAAAASDSQFAAASWNLELGARSGADAAAAIADLDVDLVALQELGPEHAAAIEASAALAEHFPHRELYPDIGVLGMGLLSSYPIVRAEFRQDPSLIAAVIDVDGWALTVIDAHPLAGRIELAGPIPFAFDTTGRDDRLDRIRERIEDALARGESVIALGDFNATPTEPGFLELAEGLYDAHAEVGQGPGWTWRPSRFEWAGFGVIRIDHALSTARLPPRSVSERCGSVGDHCILEVRYSLRHY